MTIMGSVDISFTNSTKIAKGAEQTANTAQETANGAAQTAGQAQATAETATQTATQAASTANSAKQTADTALQSANGKNKTYYGSDQPINPQAGDSWFKQDTNGIFVALYHYDGVQWVLDVDGTAIAQTQTDVSTALTQANSALSIANEANTSARSAIDKAQDGFDAAQAALSATNSLAERMTDAEGNISALQQTSSSFATRINNAENDITSLAQTAQGLQTQVTNNKNDITTVTQTALALQTRMTNAEGSINTLTSTASSLTSQIGTLQTNLDNLSIGGRNLLYNSTFNFGLDGWENTTSAYSVLSPESDKPKSNILRITSASSTSQESSRPFPIVANQSYVISFDVRIDTNANTNNLLFTVRTFDSADISNSQANAVWYQNLLSYQNITVTNTWKRFTFTITPTAGKYLRVIPYNAYTGSKADFREIKVEIGSGKATDWSPAPEDLATQSQITQLANDINLRVKVNDVVNQINISTEGILIDGKKIHITGDTTIDNAVIKSAMIDSVSASKISADSLSAISANLGNVTAGTLTGVTINAGTFNSSGDRGNLTISQDSLTTTKTTVSGSTTTIETIETFGGSMLFNTEVNSTITSETLIDAGSVGVINNNGSTNINGGSITTSSLSVDTVTSDVSFQGAINLTYGSSEVSALVSSGQIQSVSFWSTGASTFNQILTGNLSASRGGAINLNNGDIIGANGIYLNDAANVDGEGIVFPWSTSTNVLDVTQADCLRAYNGRLLLNGDVVHTEKSMMIATGYVVITPSAANEPTYVTISFGKTFPVVPTVVVTPNSTVAGKTVTGWAATDVTTKGCKIWVTRTNTTDTGIQWIAVADNTAWTANAVG